MPTNKGVTRTFWVTREGQRIAVRDMGDRHLLNTINMLERKAPGIRQSRSDALLGALGYLRGEDACACVDSAITALDYTTDEELLMQTYPCYETMLNEAGKRRLL